MELRTAKGRLFFFAMLVISMPLLESDFHFIESGKLNGGSENVPDPQFSLAKWWDGSYRKQKTRYINDSMGFRPDLVRINNQLDYWLFRKLHAGDVYVGHDNYLFGKLYVDEYYGRDYIGTATIRKKLMMLRRVQDTLERMGKTFVLVYAPSKPYLYQEQIPDCLRETTVPDTTNYRSFRRLGDSLKIRQVDFNAWFVSMKETSKDVLMGRQGVRWTMYGGLIAGDSMTRYVEQKRNIRMPQLVIKSVNYSTEAQHTDDDLFAVSNLIFPITKEQFTYADYFFRDSGTTRPRAIYIGDSFLWTWITNGQMHSTNTDWEFWCYFYQVWTEQTMNNGGSFAPRAFYDWQRSLANTDCVIVVLTPPGLKDLAFKDSFIDVFYNYFFPNV